MATRIRIPKIKLEERARKAFDCLSSTEELKLEEWEEDLLELHIRERLWAAILNDPGFQKELERDAKLGSSAQSLDFPVMNCLVNQTLH